jgi:hypothetical protein
MNPRANAGVQIVFLAVRRPIHAASGWRQSNRLKA